MFRGVYKHAFGERKDMKNDKKIIRQIPYMVVAYVFMLMIYAPMELYLVNID